MTFYDKNGTELKIGDHIVPDEGHELELTEQKEMEEFEGEVLIGKQVENPQFFSILTQDNLSLQWTKIEVK